MTHDAQAISPEGVAQAPALGVESDLGVIQFFVAGIPAPGGSKRVFGIKKGGVYTGRFVVTDDAGQHNKDWRTAVAWAAREVFIGKPLLHGPLGLRVVFHMPRPKAHFRANGTLKELAPGWHTSKPDTTKLMRALEDALTGIAWHDDSEIVIQTGLKVYSDRPGAKVFIFPFSQCHIACTDFKL